LYAKLLKTRDSAGVGSTVSFLIDWATLTFSPISFDDRKQTGSYSAGYSNKVGDNYDSKNESEYGVRKQSIIKKEPKKLTSKKPEDTTEYDVEDLTEDDDKTVKRNTGSVLNGVKSKNHMRQLVKVI